MHHFRPARTGAEGVSYRDLVMANLTAGQVEAGTGGILLEGSRESPISGVSIDSRTLLPGDLFFAIRGVNQDGHRFIRAALDQGASGAVFDRDFDPSGLPAGSILLQVADTHRALKSLASEVRSRWRGSLVAITGSVGKTTTKEFAVHVLESEYSVYRSPGNYNNLFGLPLSLLGLSDEDHIGIFEMGMSAPGEIAEMCRIARPDVGVLTNVAPVHLEFFESIDGIARAKGELTEGLPAEGTLIYNIDDERVREIARRYRGNRISFGFSESADVRADEIEESGLNLTRFRLSCGGRTRRAHIPLLGRHYVLNVLPAVALGLHYRISLDQMAECLHDLRQVEMRGEIHTLANGIVLFDDSYNSNPMALRQMISNLAAVPGASRRILVAGEMLELGNASRELHYMCGEWAARSGIDIVVGVQGDAAELVRGARAGGLPEERTGFFANPEAAVDYLRGSLRPGDVLLVKGSRGVHLEKTVRALRRMAVEENR